MAAFANRISTNKGGDRLREGATPPEPPVAGPEVVAPLYVIVEEGRTQVTLHKADRED